MIWKVLSYPRYRLTSLPTPLERATRLSKELGVELLIKRDDVMELCLGGNKVRKLEFIIADALKKGCDVLITRGATHSNHVRLTAAAAKKAGLDVYAVITPPGSLATQGNILLDRLLDVKLVPISRAEEADEAMEKLAEKLKSAGRRPYVIPVGGASELGVLGYALGALEILQQSLSLGVKPNYIVHATGTGATQAGLTLGLKLLGASDVKVLGISNGRKASEVTKRLVDLFNSTAEMLGVGVKASESDFTVYDEYSFGGYGVITSEVVNTIKYVARTEGVLLDPVYTAKAMYGLIDLVQRGVIKKESSVVFIHTGGSPIVFQYASEVEKYL
ncbi:MAG: D-cysteine desulfhydrase family protein [Sulfolobales archaeon]